MAYTSLLRFGSKVNIEITRDENRRLCRLRTLLDDQEEGYLLETDGEKQQGSLFVLPSQQLHESFQDGLVTTAHQNEEATALDYEEWVHSCIQQATAWARSYAIQTANNSIASGAFAQARETYHDVIDHFPPPPDGPLLHWNYYRCIAQMEGINAAKEGLLMWLDEALPIAGINVNSAILDPAKDLLGEDVAIDVAKKWLKASSPHDPAHKMTKRWLDKQGQEGALALTWDFGQENPLQAKNSLLIPLLNGDILVVGGETAEHEFSKKAAIWHKKTHSWTPISDVPVGLKYHAGIAIDESSVIIAGGSSKDEEYSRNVFLWSYATDEWTEEESLSIGRKNPELIRMDNGKIIVFGGEDLLRFDTSMEIRDRRTGQWTQIEHSGLYLSDVCLVSMGDYIIASGSSVITSGFGALYWSAKTQKWIYPEEIRGIGIDGVIALSSSSAIVWSRKNGAIDVGIWSLGAKSINWSCKDVEIMARSDLSMLLHYDEEHCILLSTNSDMTVQARSINPMTGTISELSDIQEKKIFFEETSAATYNGGVFMTYPTGWASL